MNKLRSKALLSILLCVACLISCQPTPTPLPLPLPPEQTLDGWQTASLSDVGIDPEPINRLVENIRDGRFENIHSVLIVQDGKLVFEEYFDGYAWNYDDAEFRGEVVEFDAATTHNLASVTKSFTSALIGIAIDRGFILGVDEKMFDFFPEYAYLDDEAKKRITLEHLLTMTSGLEWNEMAYPYSSARNDLVRLFQVSDPIEYILAKPVANEPGTHWYYCGGGTNILGEIIRQSTGSRMDDFAAEYLFAPLGIMDYEWDHINADMIHASGNLKLRPRDMAKFGYLYLNGGVWQGERIISQEWVEASMQEWTDGYGYQWWLETYRSDGASVDSFFADGWGGQRIIVFPSLDMVLVFTGGNYVDPHPLDDMITDFILPSVP